MRTNHLVYSNPFRYLNPWTICSWSSCNLCLTKSVSKPIVLPTPVISHIAQCFGIWQNSIHCTMTNAKIKQKKIKSLRLELEITLCLIFTSVNTENERRQQLRSTLHRLIFYFTGHNCVFNIFLFTKSPYYLHRISLACVIYSATTFCYSPIPTDCFALLSFG